MLLSILMPYLLVISKKNYVFRCLRNFTNYFFMVMTTIMSSWWLLPETCHLAVLGGHVGLEELFGPVLRQPLVRPSPGRVSLNSKRQGEHILLRYETSHAPGRGGECDPLCGHDCAPPSHHECDYVCVCSLTFFKSRIFGHNMLPVNMGVCVVMVRHMGVRSSVLGLVTARQYMGSGKIIEIFILVSFISVTIFHI